MNFSQIFFQLLLFGFHEVTKRTSAKSRASMFTPLHIYVPVSMLVHVYVHLCNCLCMQIYLCVHVGVVGGAVCVWILYAHKKKKQLGWIRSCTCGNTLSRNSFHEIHNEAGLSSDVAPLLASHRLQPVCVCIRVSVRPCKRAREECVCVWGGGDEKELLHLTLRSSFRFIPLKNTQKTTNWLRRALRWAKSLRRIGGPPLPSLPVSLSAV